MGTPRQSAGERTRERILDAALPLFAQNGFAGTSTRMIAQAAKVNVATLAYHFEDKEGLYNTVVQRLHEALIAGWQGGTPPNGWPGGEIPSSPEAIVHWWIHSAWKFAQEHKQHVRLLTRHVLDRGGYPEVVLEKWSEPLLTRAETIISPFRPEWSSQETRLFALSVMHLLARYSLENEEQLAHMLGGEDTNALVVSWLENFIRNQLGM